MGRTGFISRQKRPRKRPNDMSKIVELSGGHRPVNFYAYLWLREDGSPYYAGKGTGRRAYESYAHGVHRPKDRSRIIIFDKPSEQDAFDAEKELIRRWGRIDNGTGCLRNLTDGGEGVSGSKHTEEWKRANSLRHLGKHRSLKTRLRISRGKKGKSPSASHRTHLRDVMKNRPWSAARREAQRLRQCQK